MAIKCISIILMAIKCIIEYFNGPLKVVDINGVLREFNGLQF